ncbi:DNA polymerase III subunit epsilon [Lamprobacter modestohalophilus]|uniref:DNA polymerase III subunit epsilon n=1 Tax=Lamprobacter modestohalophilus TaxID=1064514 RepID=A0A9X0W5M1_9GAMM|nr:DNA polymerase III subunit epsilon [Lamprobacter modestohalophilus]MBK1617335.1 DNA polymerase III subunit epsilon [Lamprobacter modestohalophilus]MEA1052002.1 DNA polymerase III subunit epsilon [Lamprobacter modestohalophilus]
MRQLVVDTETTGLEPSEGHRVIEIGCVEVVERQLTKANFHRYLQPDREIDAGAVAVHGISNAFLADKPRFAEIAEELIEYLRGAELVIHNAAFDVGFLNHELSQWRPDAPRIEDICTVVDTLALARKRHPGQRNSLDALCRRYEIDNTRRDLHGALLDAEILADVYLAMTGGQVSLALGSEANRDGRDGGGEAEGAPRRVRKDRPALRIVRATELEQSAHRARLEAINAVSQDGCVWLSLSGATGSDRVPDGAQD